MITKTSPTRLVFLITAIISINYFNSYSQEKPAIAPVLSTIVIDPGHGGDDPGAVAQDVQEKDVVLDIALRLGKAIKNSFPAINVIYTRKTDVFIPLYQRAEIANKNKADLFISIHANYFSKPNIRGTETFVLGLHRSEENLEVAKKENSVILLEKDYSTNYEGFDPNSSESYIIFELVQDQYLDQSIMVASSVQEQFSGFARLEDRGVKQAGFIVLKRTAMPSILIETGFLTNAQDRNYLTSIAGKENITQSILNAISQYIRKVEDKTGVFLAGQTGGDSDRVTPVADSGRKQENVPVQKKDPPTAKSLNHSVNQKTEIEKPESKPEKADSAPVEPTVAGKWYVAQIAASVKPIEIIPKNFKGEKNVFTKKIGVYYKYYSGKFATIDEAEAEISRVGKKFPGAFIVVFDGDKVYPLKK